MSAREGTGERTGGGIGESIGESVGGSTGERGLVVGAAILRDGRLLAARRTRPAALAGRWELPGGKVEPGERPEAALVREIAEELGLEVTVEEWLDHGEPLGAGRHLRVARCAAPTGEVRPREHDAVRWLGPGELEEVDWLEPDRPFVGLLAALLSAAGGASSIASVDR